MSETRCGNDWLQQFSGNEQVLATSLINSLEFYSTDAIKSDLLEFSLRAIKKQKEKSNLLVCPVYSHEDAQKYFEANCGPTTSDPNSLKAIDDYNPLDVACNSIGSESILLLVQRDIYKNLNKSSYSMIRRGEDIPKFVADSLFNQTQFIFLSDTSLSGTQALSFIESMCESELLRLNGSPPHPISVSFICWQASEAARSKLETLCSSFNIECNIICLAPTVELKFGKTKIYEDLLEFLDKYAKHNRGLGYGGVGSLSIPLLSSVPNNVPDILIKKRGGVRPLFPERVLPAEILNPDHQIVADPDLDGSWNIFHNSLIRNGTLGGVGLTSSCQDKQWLYILLVAMGNSEQSIRGHLKVSYSLIEEYKDRFLRLKWVDHKGEITPAGLQSLKVHSRRQGISKILRGEAFEQRRLDAGTQSYYPTSVRGVQ